MNEGDFIRIDYIGKVSESGEIFDLTKESVAKEMGIFNPEFKYGSVPVILGAHHVVKGLENELMKMEVGKSKKVTVKPEDALGERKSELIRLIPLSEFKKRDIDPTPGMSIIESGVRGRVLSVSGGRVRVDSNHPLAGKTLEYDVEIKEMITDKRDKIRAIVELFYSSDEKNITIKIIGEIVEIIFNNKEVPQNVKKMIADNLKKWVADIKKVKFIEEF